MALRGLHRITHRIFPTACDCNNMRAVVPLAVAEKLKIGPTALYCSEITRPLVTDKSRRRMNTKGFSSSVVPPGVAKLKCTSRMSFSTLKEQEIQEEKEAKLTLAARVKILWKRYGMLTIGTYFSIYFATLSSVFLALDYQLVNFDAFGFDPHIAVNHMADVVQDWTGYDGIPKYLREHPHVGTFAMAWVMTKFTEPPRLAITAVAVPAVARYLGRKPEVVVDEELNPK